MKVDVVEKSELGRELVIEISPDKVEEERRVILKEISKEAQVEGFRKGKVPENIIEARYSDTIKENLLKRIVPEAYVQATKEKGLEPGAEPDLYDTDFEGGGLKFKIFVELKPEVKLGKYKGVTFKKLEADEVTEQQVDEVLASWEKRPEMAAALADPEKRKSWKEKIRQQQESYNSMVATVKEEEEIWNNLLAESVFPVPQKIVNQRALGYTEEQLGKMNIKDKTVEEREKIAKDIFEQAKPVAEKDVRKFFILDKVADIEKITVEESDLEPRISRISQNTGETSEKVKEKIINAGKMDDMKSEIRMSKAFGFIKENAVPVAKIILPGQEKEKK